MRSASFPSLDENRRAAIVKEEALQQERNAASKSIGEMMREGKRRGRDRQERVRTINEELDEISAEARRPSMPSCMTSSTRAQHPLRPRRPSARDDREP